MSMRPVARPSCRPFAHHPDKSLARLNEVPSFNLYWLIRPLSIRKLNHLDWLTMQTFDWVPPTVNRTCRFYLMETSILNGQPLSNRTAPSGSPLCLKTPLTWHEYGWTCIGGALVTIHEFYESSHLPIEDAMFCTKEADWFHLSAEY